MAQRYGTPVGRSRHGKRLPQGSDDSASFTGPVTVTVNEPFPIVTPTITVFVVPSSSTQPPSATLGSTDADSSPVVITPSETPASSGSGYGAATTNNGASNTGTMDAAQISPSSVASTSAVSSSSISVGAIVGIVLAVVLLFAAGAVIWFRRRAISNRLKTRQWAKQKNNSPSFLWIDSKDSGKITPFPVMSSNTLQPYRSGDPEANMNMLFGGPAGMPNKVPSNNGLPYMPPPAPPRPPPAASMHEVPPSTPDPSIFATSLYPAVVQASSHVTAAPLSPAPPASPSPGKLVEPAKVRSTFIPTLPDELSISTGEMVRIHAEYDDGWALCSNARGEVGMVPLECLDKASQPPAPNREYRKSVRVSSLAANTKAVYGGY